LGQVFKCPWPSADTAEAGRGGERARGGVAGVTLGAMLLADAAAESMRDGALTKAHVADEGR